MRRTRLLPVVVLLVSPLFAASNAVPVVNLPLVPSTTAPGSASFTIRVNGSGFAQGAVVKWNGVPLATTFVNHDRLKAVVPAGDVALAGTATVTVTNPAPGGGTSNSAPFTATLPTPSLTFATSVINVGVNPAGIVAADFNHDGKTDLVVYNQNQPDACYNFGGLGTIQTLLGNGTGGFTAGSSACLLDEFSMAGEPFLVAGDFDGDGNLDVGAEFRSRLGFGFAAFLGDGTGTFTWHENIESFDGMGQPVLGDFNRDGKLDTAFPDDFVSSGKPAAFFGVEDFFGDGTGNFGFGFDFGFLIAGPLVAGDFNGDGILDLATATNGTPALTILLGNTDGSFTAAATQPTTTLVSPSWIATGDFNGDGFLDLAFADSGSTALTILLGHGDGTFTQKFGQPDAGQITTFITTADLNGDGKLDLALVDSSNAVLIYLGNGDGTFQTALSVAAGNGAAQLAVGDFKGDGRPDLAVTNSVDNTVTVLLQSPAATVSRDCLTFGRQKVGTTSEPERVLVTNTGSAHLSIQSITASGDFFQANLCGAGLNIGQSCEIDVVFKPTAKGLRTGTVTITDDAGNNPQVITLTGKGI